jgi:hypothetical protein
MLANSVIFIERGKFGQRYMRENVHVKSEAHIGDNAATSLGMPRISGKHQK